MNNNIIKNLDEYQKSLETCGLQATWNKIFVFLKNKKSREIEIFQQEKIGLLYEKGLAFNDKNNKQAMGQYFTPIDVSNLLSDFLIDLKGENIADVCCGVGNLIISFLKLMGLEKSRELILKKKIWLYDNDPTALEICKDLILREFGEDLEQFLNIECGDFLNQKVKLPSNCKVISNPPYFKTSIKEEWGNTEIQKDTQELYACFMEKIIKQSVSSVIITPQSFLGGKKYFTLRQLMNEYSGCIWSFDNVPGQIFNGKKEGIFNTNISNSVRAAITVIENDSPNGMRISPLIRFKNSERTFLLNKQELVKVSPLKHQKVSQSNSNFLKNFKELETTLECWLQKSKTTMQDSLVLNSLHKLYIANTCRYFTNCSTNSLQRSGLIELNFKNEKSCDFFFILLNSSFAYWWWRLNDGGVTYPIGLLKSLPSFEDILTEKDWDFIKQLKFKMLKNVIIKTKMNCGIKENITYPEHFRIEINEFLMRKLELSNEETLLLEIVHKNSYNEG